MMEGIPGNGPPASLDPRALRIGGSEIDIDPLEVRLAYPSGSVFNLVLARPRSSASGGMGGSERDEVGGR